jgi:hypothetical protein
VALALTGLAASASTQLALQDVAASSGITNLSFGKGSATVDLDGDGLLDVVAGNAGMENVYFRQLPDHSFVRMNETWGAPVDTWSTWGVVVTDLDGDADPDCFFGSGGFGYAHPNQVVRNDLDTTGQLTDVSASAGDVSIPSHTFGVTSLDYDQDGDVDIYTSGREDLSVFLRNDGGLVFTDVAADAGVDLFGDLRHATAGDYDNDGWVDIGVGEANRNPRLYQNQGDGSFVDRADDAGLIVEETWFGFVLEDFDNDGLLDAFLPNYRYVGYPVGSLLYLNNGDGSFRDALDGGSLPANTDMGHNTGDINGDGYPDLFIGTGEPANTFDDVLYLIAPSGDGLFFVDVSAASGVQSAGPSRAHGSPFFDYDEDGDLDLYVNNGGPEWVPSTLEDDFLWRNHCSTARHLTLSLHGVLSNRSAVHAKAVVLTSEGRTVWRRLTAGKGFGNTDSPRLLFGLESHESATLLEVHWPSGVVQRHWSPPTDAQLSLVETGLRLVDEQLPGVITTLDAVGPPGAVSELLVGFAPAFLPLPAFGGVLEISPLEFDPIPLPLGGDGVISVPIPEAGDPLLVGLELRVQAFVHGAGSDPVLSNTVVIVLE